MTIRRKIAVVTATRAEYGLLYWLLRELESAADAELQLIASGAHLSPRHGMTVRQIEADGFPIAAQVDMQLGDDSPVGISRSLGVATIGFAEAYASLQPDVVVLLGDRYEMLAAAQAATIARIPLAHVHGGETTEGAIDEAIRHAITKMAQLHFVAAEEFRQRVIQLGEAPERVFTVGAAGLDNIAQLALLDKASLQAQLGFTLRSPSVLLTYHPVTLTGEDQGAAMRCVLDALDQINASVIVTGVNADPGASAIRYEAEVFAAARPGRVLMAESLGSLRYLSAMRHVDVVVGNSSSGLLEAPAIGTPTVDIGMRQQGRLSAPSVIHCDADTAAVHAALLQALSEEHRAAAARRETPYGTPGAAKRMAALLREFPLDGILVKRFHDLVPQGGQS